MLDKLSTLEALIVLIDIFLGFILTQIVGQVFVKPDKFKEKISVSFSFVFIYFIILTVVFNIMPDTQDEPIKLFLISLAFLIVIILSFILLYKYKTKGKKKKKRSKKEKNNASAASMPRPILSRGFNSRSNQSITLQIPQFVSQPNNQPLEQSLPQTTMSATVNTDKANNNLQSSVKINNDTSTNQVKHSDTPNPLNDVNIENIDCSDPMLEEAIKVVVEAGQASTFLLQRRLRLGYARADRLIDTMEEIGIVGPHEGSRSRKVLITYEQWLESGIAGTLALQKPKKNNMDMLEAELKAIYNAADKIEKEIDALSESIQNKSEETNKNQSIEDYLSQIDAMSAHGEQFERFCQELLIANGFKNVKTTRSSGDFGVDLLAVKDDVTYAIQCKCYSSSVGNKAVQEAFSGKSYYNCMVAAVLTNNYFTTAAINTAKANSVLLWDRNKLKAFLSVYQKNTDKDE